MTGNLGRQLSDLVAYILLPLACLLLPTELGGSLLRRCATRGWVLGTRSQMACETAGRLMFIPDRQEWRRRWRLVELTEARDVWFCWLGRTRGLLAQMEIDGVGPGAESGQALIGLHWGPSILALVALRRMGLAPRFVHRPVETAIRRLAPFQYAYLLIMVRVINAACEGRAITVPGARAGLAEALAEPGLPVLLMDAPPTQGLRVIRVNLLGRTTTLAADGLRLLAERRARCTFYAMGLDRTGVGKQLSFTVTITTDSPRELATLVADHFNRFVLADSAQWRLWHAAGQLFDFHEGA